MNLFPAEHEPAEGADDRTRALAYNALYMLSWQIGRVQAGVWDDYSLRLLEAGAATAARLHASGITVGKYGTREIAALRDDAWKLINSLDE